MSVHEMPEMWEEAHRSGQYEARLRAGMLGMAYGGTGREEAPPGGDPGAAVTQGSGGRRMH